MSSIDGEAASRGGVADEPVVRCQATRIGTLGIRPAAEDDVAGEQALVFAPPAVSDDRVLGAGRWWVIIDRAAATGGVRAATCAS